MHSRFEHQPFADCFDQRCRSRWSRAPLLRRDALPFCDLLDRDRSIARSWNIDALPSTVCWWIELETSLIGKAMWTDAA